MRYLALALCVFLSACAASPAPPSLQGVNTPSAEAELAELRADMGALLHALEERAQADAQLAGTIANIRTRRQAAPRPVTTAAKPVAPPTRIAPARARPEPKPAPVKAKGSAVTGLRLGAHPGRTRLVLDLDGPMGHSHDFDAAEGVLILTLPQAKAFGPPAARRFAKNPHVSGYTATTGKNGTVVIMVLRKGARLAHSEALKPAGRRGYRLVFDLTGG